MDDFEVNAVVNKQTVNNFEVETIVKEPAEKSDNDFEVEVIVNEQVERNDTGFEVKENP